MVQAFSVLASLPVLRSVPMIALTIIPADYVGKAIVAIHQKEKATQTLITFLRERARRLIAN